MAKKYLDNTGLSTLWNIIKNALNLKLNINGDAYRASSIPMGEVDSTSTSTVFTATVDGITELRDGVCMWLKNGVVTSASGFTININNLGAKPVYSNLAEASRSTTIFNVAYTMLFVYNESRVTGGCWDIVYGYDSNTNTIGYQIRHNSGTGKASAKTYRYRLLFTGDDDTLVPANTSSSTNATSVRAVNQTPIDPFGSIYYYGSTSAVNADSSFGAASLWQQYAISLGYSFNQTGEALTLTYPKAVYIKATPTNDGKAIIDADTPYVQTLPSTEDGKIYIYLGQAYSATNVELDINHPVYYFYNGEIQLWTGIKAEENQNAFSNIKIDSTVVSADSKTDTLELTAGNNITLTPDTTNDKVTIAATDTTYSAGTGLSLSGTTFSNSGVTGVKGGKESSYRTGQVNITYDNVNAIGSKVIGNTQELYRPLQLNGCNDITIDQKISTLRANRLAFLPADQIIIEKTTDGGITWEDGQISDDIKLALFSEIRPSISIPLINGIRDVNSGLRITITGMRYNVPSGTLETEKYNYWNSDYILSCERYCQLKEIYFWVSSANDGIGVKVERATGADSNNWISIYDSGSSYALTGWSGCNYIRFSQSTFGGGITQATNFWNYRFTFFTRNSTGGTELATTSTTNAQAIYEIRGYGDTYWAKSNEYMANDKLYTHDAQKNVQFPAKITATTKVSTPIVETGNTAQSYFQTERLRGEGDANAYYHAIDFGRYNHNQVDFYEYGGVFNFHKHTGAAIGTGDTLLGTINDKGWDGKVNNHTINADVPANAVFTDTTYSEATTTTSGLMSATDKAHLDAVYSDYSSALTALGVI